MYVVKLKRVRVYSWMRMTMFKEVGLRMHKTVSLAACSSIALHEGSPERLLYPRKLYCASNIWIEYIPGCARGCFGVCIKSATTTVTSTAGCKTSNTPTTTFCSLAD
jgi:hypothetical protein